MGTITIAVAILAGFMLVRGEEWTFIRDASIFLWVGGNLLYGLFLLSTRRRMINSARKRKYTRIKAKPAVDYNAQIRDTVDAGVWSIAGHEQARVWTSPEAIKHFGAEYCDEQLKQFYRYEADARGKKK